MTSPAAASVGKGRLALFAFGDFAFNLYWQSVMLFLLFYYTEALELPMAVAATIYMAASVWDGAANFVAGVLTDRRKSVRGFGVVLGVGSIPLGLSFVLAYLPPPFAGTWGAATVFAGHLLFRTAYAAINVPYLAMSARVSSNPDDRAFVAGLRMLSGTAAAVLVALSTVPLGTWLSGSGNPAQTYLAAAMLFASVGTLVLMIVGATYRDATHDFRPYPARLSAALLSLVRNRAFVALNLAMMAMIVAVTVLNKSVLYYFKYLVGNETAGQLALASMGAVSAAAVPAWMILGRWLGLRALWLVAAISAMVGLAAFSAVDIHGAGATQLFLIVMQAMFVGMFFAFWAMLPNTIEYGERATGLHVEGTVFGLSALLQRVAIGAATAILGWSFADAGFVANVPQSEATRAGMRATIALVPLVFLALSCAAMLWNPLGRPAVGR